MWWSEVAHLIPAELLLLLLWSVQKWSEKGQRERELQGKGGITRGCMFAWACVRIGYGTEWRQSRGRVQQRDRRVMLVRISWKTSRQNRLWREYSGKGGERLPNQRKGKRNKMRAKTSNKQWKNTQNTDKSIEILLRKKANLDNHIESDLTGLVAAVRDSISACVIQMLLVDCNNSKQVSRLCQLWRTLAALAARACSFC